MRCGDEDDVIMDESPMIVWWSEASSDWNILTSTDLSIEVLTSIDLDEYYMDKIVTHEEKGKNSKNWKFKVKWSQEENVWINQNWVLFNCR